MNIVLLEPNQITTTDNIWQIENQRQLQHLQQHIQLNCGDTLKVGVRNGQRYLTEVISVSEQQIRIRPIQVEAIPAKLPVHLILALPRPKVLRRIIMDAVTLGVERISLIHSYRVDKSYWQSPFLQQLDDYVTLGLGRLVTRLHPKFNCINALNLLLKMFCLHLFRIRNLLMSHTLMQNSRCLMRFNIHVT